MTGRKFSSVRLIAGVSVFALCCVADLFVLRTTWTGRQILEGQFRRGYFERFDGKVSLAVDDVIRPIFPSCVLMPSGELAVPPGMSAVVPLEPGADYDVATDQALAPYVVLAAEAPVEPVAKDGRLRSGEARLTDGRTLVLRDGSLAWAVWDASRPWSEDVARLSALRAACGDVDESTMALTVTVSTDDIQLNLGRCSLVEPRPARLGDPPLQLAALAGPDWITLTRRPGWRAERWVMWPVVAIVAAKVLVTWWGAGLVAAAALSVTLAGMAVVMPVPATLTWPLTLLIGVAAAVVRAVFVARRRLPSRWRLPVALAVAASIVAAVVMKPDEPRLFPPIIRSDESRQTPDACAMVGYSTAGGAGLRGGHGGASVYLDENCEACLDRTGSLTAGGETLEWARDAYCASESGFGAGGHLIFFGGANDDFLWGLTSMARLFIVGEQGIEPWRQSQAPAAAASLAWIDEQTAALDGLMQCARSRQAEFLFLHDFLVTDMVADRDEDRVTMLMRRRAAVEAAGGRFVDLLDVFGPVAGIAWFNDYVHPSSVAHERIGELACRSIS